MSTYRIQIPIPVEDSWHWAVQGKHSTARDFIQSQLLVVLFSEATNSLMVKMYI